MAFFALGGETSGGGSQFGASSAHDRRRSAPRSSGKGKGGGDAKEIGRKKSRRSHVQGDDSNMRGASSNRGGGDARSRSGGGDSAAGGGLPGWARADQGMSESGRRKARDDAGARAMDGRHDAGGASGPSWSGRSNEKSSKSRVQKHQRSASIWDSGQESSTSGDLMGSRSSRSGGKQSS